LEQPQRLPIPAKLKLYITLAGKNDTHAFAAEYKKLVLMIEETALVRDLKRQIEREFAELFPAEPPYVVAKIDDSNGFSLSN